jgi:transposase-like protein
MENNKQVFDYEALKKKTLEQFRSGKNLYGKGGAFAPLLKEFLEAALQAELDDHLEGEEPEENNRKNGYTTKQLKTDSGTIELDTPRDRNAEFTPQIVRKRETILAESLETKIIAFMGGA